LGLLVITVAAILTAVVLFFDPDDYRDEIAALVEWQTGRDLTIEGDTAWSLYPWLGLLLLKSPLLRINGAGTANLMTEELDYLLKASVVATLEGQGTKDLEGLKGITVPVKVEGSFSDPRSGPDVDTLLKERAKSKIEEKKQELQQKLEDKLRESLKGIF
jgi:uncharacterized protein involved in outer membrane biogenesis